MPEHLHCHNEAANEPKGSSIVGTKTVMNFVHQEFITWYLAPINLFVNDYHEPTADFFTQT